MDVQRVHRLNEYAYVVRQDLAQRLVNLADVALGAYGASELALNREVGCFDAFTIVSGGKNKYGPEEYCNEVPGP